MSARVVIGGGALLAAMVACSGGTGVVGESGTTPDGGTSQSSSTSSSSSSSSGSTASSSSSSSGGTTGDAGPVPLPATFDQTWIAICTTALASKDPAQAFRFWAESAVAADGTLALKLTPLEGWKNGDYTTPANATATYRREDVLGVAGIFLANDGRFFASFGKWEAEASANSISGRELVVENTSLDGKYDAAPGAQGFCARLGGKLTVPYEYVFVPQDNVCLFRKAVETDPMPALQQADFVCAL